MKRFISTISIGKAFAMVLLAALLVMTACGQGGYGGYGAPAASPTPPPQATQAPSPTPSGAAYTVNVASKAGIGNYLVDGKGMTLYYFTRDSVGKSNATAAQLATWPIFYVTQFVLPPPLDAEDFGSITRDDGKKMTTYYGWPLYYYINDKAPGDTNGQGIGNVWFVINPENFPPKP